MQKSYQQDQKTILFNDKDTASLDNVKTLLGYVPDVYYIIPDGYANYKVLEKFLGYDNDEFLSYLEDKKFTVVTDSRSNYGNTLFSVPSILNMEPIEAFSDSTLSARKQLMEWNKVVYLFKNLGYKYIAISSDDTAFSGTVADIRFGSSLLYRILIKSTIFNPISQRFRGRVLNAFDGLEKASAISGPKFVFAHIIAPHDPYVFGSNGEDIGFNSGEERSPNDMALYVEQLKFVNKKIKEAIDIILKNSSRTPVIIIQSDHGVLLPDFYDAQTAADARLRNLSAYLLPETRASSQTSEIPPDDNINTFRFIFDQYFGTRFGLIEEN
ncbi:MAG: hypothetical protein Q8Q48_03005 [Candidatus Staskawiczbacteria bacterium]|nr:hypothetical protein [Candidatus Staskawiczbacteria bacterium]